tara:strand:- start:296 stop:2521 length:2226 start_codon:yes stop_codon:yes gene_type:complete
MSTEFYNRNWRMPKSSNSSKVSNYSMEFDGTELIDCGNDVILQPVNAVSISAWVNFKNIISYGAILFTGNGNGNTGCYLLTVISNNFYFYIRYGSTWQFVQAAGFTITTNNWIHVVATYDKQNLKLYINNSSPYSQPETNSLTYGASSSTHIGAYNNNYFDGKIDHVAIFDYALTDGTGGTVNQIAELYGNSTNGVGNPMAISGGRKPVAYYPIGDYAAFNGSEYLVPNGALQDYVFKGDYNEYIDTSFSTPAGPKTISIWFKADTASGYQGLFYGSNTSSAMSIGAATSFVANIGLSWFANYTGVKQHIALTTGVTTYQDGEWHNMTYVYDGSTKFIYIDGQSQAITYRFGSGYSTDTSLDLNFENIKLGSNNLSGATDVLFSNVQIFNTALSAIGSNSVETLYNNGTPLSDMSGFTSLQAWWKLDASATFDSSTTTWSIPDDSSNSNTGTSSGMTAANLVQSNLNITTPYSRYALNFDSASSDYIDCGTGLGNALGTTSQLSVSFWAKIPTGNSSKGFFTFGDFSSTVGEFTVYMHTNTTMRFRGSFGNNNITGFPLDSWTNVVCVFNGNGNCNVYFDGVPVHSFTLSGQTLDLTSKKVIIGGWFSSATTINGELSNVSIWNAALTSTQVTEIYNQGKPSNLNNHSAYSNLVGWWQLGENMSYDSNVWTVLDEKGTNNGTGANLAPAEDSIVNGVGTSANGLSDGMGGADNIIGDAPYSTANAVSYGMGADAKSTSVPS